MKHTVRLFGIGLRQIAKDGMLAVMLPAPFLVGLFFKFVVPFINTILIREFSFSLTPWYGLVDGLLICLTPMFAAMISAFLLLEERDEGVQEFYQITPAEGYSYLFARIGLPMIGAFIITIIVAALFNLSTLSAAVILSSSLVSSLTGVFLAMMVVSIAGNRVEGLAVAKLMGISFAGLLLIWFVPAPYYYVMAFLPSFWIGKLLIGGTDVISLLLGLLTCLLWIILFTRRFLKKV